MIASHAPPTVAIAGASGDLGKHVVNAFLSPKFRSKFSDVILLSRKPDFQVGGGTTRVYTEGTLAECLVGVDVVVNTIGSKNNPTAFKTAILHAIAATPTVKLYFPSEFGVDHMLADGQDPDFAHVEWIKKKKHTALARQIFAAQQRDVKICHVFVGLMTELSIGPWFGLDTAGGKYEAIGSAEQKASYTSMVDIGKTVAQLASLSAEDCPGFLRVSGDAVSVTEIAGLMDEAAGLKKGERIKVESIDAATYREKLVNAKQDPDDAPEQYLRMLTGSGKLNFTSTALGNLNNIVNSDQKNWTWKSMADYASEVKGRPWC